MFYFCFICSDERVASEMGFTSEQVKQFFNSGSYVDMAYVYDKLSWNPNHEEYAAFSYLKSVTPAGIIPKVLVPSPLYLVVFRDEDDPYPSVYSSRDEFFKDISQVYIETFQHFYSLGARVYSCYLVFFDLF
jgi:methionine synthase II (cobalamin-independent)